MKELSRLNWHIFELNLVKQDITNFKYGIIDSVLLLYIIYNIRPVRRAKIEYKFTYHQSAQYGNCVAASNSTFWPNIECGISAGSIKRWEGGGILPHCESFHFYFRFIQLIFIVIIFIHIIIVFHRYIFMCTCIITSFSLVSLFLNGLPIPSL